MYTPTEVYDRNAYYAVTEDNEVETSMVTDLNPEYEQAMLCKYKFDLNKPILCHAFFVNARGVEMSEYNKSKKKIIGNIPNYALCQL